MDAKLRYFPGGAGMTVADSDSLEPGDDFVVEWSGYVPATGTLIGKNAAFVLETIDSALHAIILAAQTTLGISSNTAITDNIYATSYTRIGNRFNSTGTAKYITKAELYLTKTGAPTGTAHLNVYNAANGDLIDTLDSIDVSTITGMTVHTFEGLVMVPGDVDAYVVIEYTGGDFANYINAGINTPSGAIPITRYQSGVWDDYANGVCVRITYNPVDAHLSDSITPGDHTISVTADGTAMTLSVDGSVVDTTALAGASVPDNANAWILTPSPYFDYYKHTVNGTLVGWYQPNTIISGTTLPDRAGSAEDGVITWGSNPANLAVSVGPISVGENLIVAPNTGGKSYDIAPPIGGEEYVVPNATPDTPLNPIMDAISTVMSISGSPFTVPVQILWIILATCVILACMVISMRYLPNQLIGSIVCIGLSILFWKLHVYPFAMVIFICFVCVSILIWERKPSV
jgi:hypothetical protein